MSREHLPIGLLYGTPQCWFREYQETQEDMFGGEGKFMLGDGLINSKENSVTDSRARSEWKTQRICGALFILALLAYDKVVVDYSRKWKDDFGYCKDCYGYSRLLG
ncbi:hypothetical protein BT69DRAFT_1316627 [Atractiella rhizophila]|nr:hypothetical protein BT69DRAFT_1316627 [Atractiella rhizophila]